MHSSALSGAVSHLGEAALILFALITLLSPSLAFGTEKETRVKDEPPGMLSLYSVSGNEHFEVAEAASTRKRGAA